MTKFILVVGALGQDEWAESVAEIPFPSLLAAKNAMRSLAGKKIADALALPDADNGIQTSDEDFEHADICGFNIESYTEGYGTQDVMIFNAQGEYLPMPKRQRAHLG